MTLKVARTAARAGLAVAPSAVQSWAARRFLTPRRKTPAEPAAKGLAAVRGTVRSGDKEVAFWSFGEGPAILLAHGWEGQAAQLSEFVAPIVAAGHRAVAVDMPAHGASSGEWTSLVQFARALADVAKVVGPVAGTIAHSFGGAAALFAALESESAFTGSAALIAPATNPGFFVRRAAVLLGIPARHRAGMYRRVMERVGRSFQEVDVGHRTGHLDLPLLVLHDPADPEVPVSQGKLAAAVSRRGTFEAAPGLGHRRILRDPATIARAVGFVTRGEATHELFARPALAWERRSGAA